MTPNRVAGRVGLFVLMSEPVVLAGGCKRGKKVSVSTAAGSGSRPAILPVSALPPGPVTAANPQGAEGFVRSFVTAVNDGTATPAMLNPQFKKVIAQPVFEADRAAGYSDTGAASWLAQFKGKLQALGFNPPVLGSGAEAPGFTDVGANAPARRSRYADRALLSVPSPGVAAR